MANEQNIARKPEPLTPRIDNPNILTAYTPKNIIATAPAAIQLRQQPVDPRQVSIDKVSPKARQAFGLKEGQTTATGLEKAIFIAGDSVLKAQSAIDGVFYGKFENQGSTNKFKKMLDRGVVNVLNELSEIDLCQILNLAINKIPGSDPFNPDSVPSGSFGSAKYKVQKAAYDTQLFIDGFYTSYPDTTDNETKAKGIYEVINQIKEAFKEIDDPEAQSALRDPRLLQSFPQMEAVNKFLEKAFVDFNKYTDYRQIPSQDIQKIVLSIDKIRNFTILLQGLNKPAGAIGLVDTVFPNANIQNQINRIQNLIQPELLPKGLKEISESLKKIQSFCNVFASFITTAQAIIIICTLIIKALRIIIKFLKALGIPNQFTILGLTINFSSFTIKFERSTDSLLDRLSQINTLLSLVVALVSQVSFILYDIIAKLNRMITNLELCSNVDPGIIKDLQDLSTSLKNTADYFSKFAGNYSNKKNIDSATYGNYTISIVTEEVVDDAIRLRRRYGIAQAVNGTIAAQSTPTFASDNQIIINEVKVKLASLGLIEDTAALLDVRELGIITESLNFLMDENISLTDLEENNFDSGLDPGTNEDENKGLGLNAFVNKLPGGKKLRERMRKQMKANTDKLKSNLSQSGTSTTLNTGTLGQ